MKRIALLVCGMLLLLSNTAEARRYQRTSGGSYTQPVRVTPAADSTLPASSVEATPVAYSALPTPTVQATSVPATSAAHSTGSAQGVANIMASSNRVGHWGGNPGYEGCG